MRILCEAITFGFGPISKLLSIAEVLNQNYILDYIGSGSSYFLAKRSQCFDKTYEIDTSVLDKSLISEVIDKYDVIISVLNPEFGEIALERGKRLIVIDSLFYMWKEISSVWKNCDLLIIQSLYNEKKRIKKESLKNAQIVGPIISNKIQKEASDNKLLINFGGADYPYLDMPDLIPQFICDLIEYINVFNGFKYKTITIGPRYCEKLNVLKEYGFNIMSCSHNDFLSELQTTEMLLTIPGLTTSFEAFSLGIPTLFLPPLNYSQYRNLKIFEEFGIAGDSINWDKIYKFDDNKIIESKGVKKIESFLFNSLQDKCIHQMIKLRIITLLNDFSQMKSLVKLQKEFFLNIGGNGTNTAIKYIKGFIDG